MNKKLYLVLIGLFIVAFVSADTFTEVITDTSQVNYNETIGTGAITFIVDGNTGNTETNGNLTVNDTFSVGNPVSIILTGSTGAGVFGGAVTVDDLLPENLLVSSIGTNINGFQDLYSANHYATDLHAWGITGQSYVNVHNTLKTITGLQDLGALGAGSWRNIYLNNNLCIDSNCIDDWADVNQSGASFDQSLNTYDNVTFNELKVTTGLGVNTEPDANTYIKVNDDDFKRTFGFDVTIKQNVSTSANFNLQNNLIAETGNPTATIIEAKGYYDRNLSSVQTIRGVYVNTGENINQRHGTRTTVHFDSKQDNSVVYGGGKNDYVLRGIMGNNIILGTTTINKYGVHLTNVDETYISGSPTVKKYGIYLDNFDSAGSDTEVKAIHIDEGDSYFNGDLNVTGNLEVGGCVRYNCSGGGCITVGVCV